MIAQRSVQLPVSVDEAFAWFERPGAVRRLLPPWLPLKVVREAQSLRTGTAVLDLPAGVRWHAQHQAEQYEAGRCFVDELEAGPLRTLPTRVLRWRHEHLFEPVGDQQVRIIDRIDATAPKGQIQQMLAYRHRQLAGDLAAHQHGAAAGLQPLRVAVTGASGMVGGALTAMLTTGGHTVIRLVRHRVTGPNQRQWDPFNPDPGLLQDCDAVIHLAGASILGRFTEKHRRAIETSRIEPTRKLAMLAAESGVSTFVSASATGFYGAGTGEEVVDELTPAGTGGSDFLSQVVQRWEAAAAAGPDAAMRRVQVRTGVVLDPSGGMLAVLRPIFAAGLGGRLGNGRQWLSWIGLDDLVEIYHRALWDESLHGPLNAVSPNPVRNAEFSKQLGAVMKRPVILPVPALGPKLVLGEQGAQLVAMADQRILPRQLEAAGHAFRTAQIKDALTHCLGKMADTM